jgi:predicted MFS family arabinose efflux permease
MAFVDVHFVTHLDMAGMGPAVVSGSLAVLGTFEILGALVAGRLCDRGRIKQTLACGYGLRGSAMLLVAFTPTAATSLIFGLVFGVSYMATVVATTLWVGRAVPAGAQATALGLVWTVHGIGAALSSQLGAVAAQHRHSYASVALAEPLVAVGSFALVARLPAPPDGVPTRLKVTTRAPEGDRLFPRWRSTTRTPNAERR